MASLNSRSEHLSSSRPPASSPCVIKSRGVRRVASCSAQTRKTASTPQRRRVCFSQEIDAWGVKRRCDLSEEDVDIIWYSREDFKGMKKAYMPTLKKMAKGLPLAADEEPRGLEHKTPIGNKRRHQNRLVSIDSVLREQDRQWERNRNDAEFIAELYIQSSAHCRLQASLLAKSDEDYVNENVRELSTISEGHDDRDSLIEEDPVEESENDDKEVKESLPSNLLGTESTSYDVSGLKSTRVLSAAA